ncbi:uncharacterized protein LOC126839832 isoform X2 [Adelges cooleyi]|nr:uncharacterized protein LOC126839832 isoform X2 [Adelges cooleyi]
MMVESTKKVSPSYYVNQTYNPFYVFIVNTLKTYNERKINLSGKEITVLTTPVRTYYDTKGREIVFDKFYQKIEDIKCTFSLIVKTKLAYLSNILEGLQSGGAIDVAREKLNVLKEEAGFMILLFQKGNVKAGKWFWSYYFKIMAITEYKSNKHFFEETPFGEKELQSDITKFIQHCKDNKYLPKNITEFDFVSKNSNVPIYIFQKLRTSVAVDYVYGMQSILIDYLYLKPLWDEHELFFSQITGAAVDWMPTIRRYAVEVTKTKKYIENHQWISKPFGHLSYHKLIKQIISVRMYTFMWVMLVIFNKEMHKRDLVQLKHLYTESMRIINMVEIFMHYTETLFFDIVAEFRCAINDNQINFDSIIPRMSVRANEILVELNGSNSNSSDWISIDINKEFNDNMIIQFLQEFGGNFWRLNEKLTVLNYELALSILVEGN